MPLVYQQNINENTRLAIWHIQEDEFFFNEKVSAQREITHPHKRLQHLAARFLLKELFPDFPNELIKIADTRKPFLEDEKYHFSISHCGDYAAAIVSSKSRVGIDIETISKKAARISHKFLGETEFALIQKIVDDHSMECNDAMITLAWSIKECLFKWNGIVEIDFVENLSINDIKMSNDLLSGKSNCSIQKNETINIDVDLKLMNEITVAWCV